MSKTSYNAVMRELKALKKEYAKEQRQEKFKLLREEAKNERAIKNLTRQKGTFDLYYNEDKFDPQFEVGYQSVAGFSDEY